MVLERIKEYIDFKGISISFFERSIGMSNASFGKSLKNKGAIGSDKLEIILNVYKDLNPDWLLTGEGEMLKSATASAPGTAVRAKAGKGVPYYADLPVSAGELDVVVADAVPSGYVDIPGLHALALFPVVGCSMQPDINPGDVIGVEPVKDPGKADPNKVYLIITADQRMIKHLVPDEEDPGILWAISPNYPRIKIYRDEIKSIYHVTYVGRLI